jgi:hypothetical protein
MDPKCFIMVRGVGERLRVSTLATDLIKCVSKYVCVDKIVAE